MRIGIDAKWLHRGPPSGQRVVRNLVASLARVCDADDELHLFVDARTAHDALPPSRAHRVWARVNGLSNVFVVRRAADALGLDAVVYQNFAPPSARHARVAFVHDAIFATSPEWFTAAERAYFAPMRRLAASADRVCTVSHSERDRLVRERFAHDGRVDVVPNAVDSAFTPRELIDDVRVARVRARLDLPERFVLFVGRLTARKNVATLVRAMARTPRDLHLVLAGAPDRTCAALPAVAREAGVSNRVRTLGAVDDESLAVLYATATVFCFPSLDEGFGLGPLEAMAAGTPVVVSDIPALHETCGMHAVRVSPHDADALGSILRHVATSDALRADLRAGGLRHARTFTWDRSARALLASVRAAVAQA